MSALLFLYWSGSPQTSMTCINGAKKWISTFKIFMMVFFLINGLVFTVGMLEKTCNDNPISTNQPSYAFEMIFTVLSPRQIQSISRNVHNKDGALKPLWACRRQNTQFYSGHLGGSLSKSRWLKNIELGYNIYIYIDIYYFKVIGDAMSIIISIYKKYNWIIFI